MIEEGKFDVLAGTMANAELNGFFRDDLEKRSAELAASNKELEAFAYSVSHDLRAPLRHMAGFSELLQKNSAKALDEKSKRYVGVILESAKKMGALIDDLLSFSRIGRADTNKTVVNLGQLAEEALAEVRRDLGNREIVWKVERLPAAYGDRAMLRLGLVNLFSNAVKFTNQGRVGVRVNTLPREDPARVRLRFEVSDTGTGIKPEARANLFQSFSQADSSTTRRFGGTGLGLAISKKLVDLMGGQIDFESEVNIGTTFWFELTLATGPEAAQPTTGGKASSQSQA